MKTVVATQPTYLPYTGYFRLMKEADVFVFADHVQFTSRSWQCRNRIKTPAKWVWLSVPINHNSLFSNIIDVHINNEHSWAKKHWHLLNACYSKAPYFEVHSAFFKSIYEKNWLMLSELNIQIIKYLASQLELSPVFLKSSELKPEGKRTQLAINLCKMLDADRYVSSIGAIEYMKEEGAEKLFKDAGIDLEFLTYTTPVYPQLFEEFIPDMSFIDCLFNCGPDSKKIVFDEKATTFSSLY